MYRACLALLVGMTYVAMAWGQAPGAAKPASVQPGSAVAPWLRTPYQLRLVFAFENHPALTAEYVERVKDVVQSAVMLDLGSICSVEVLTEHPYLQDITAKGLGE